MPQKDQAEQLAPRKRTTAPTPSKNGPQSPLPDAKTPLHQGAAADLQGNVGNSGLREMIAAKADQKKAAPKDPARMSVAEQASAAKQEAEKMAEARGGKKNADKEEKSEQKKVSSVETEKVALQKEAA